MCRKTSRFNGQRQSAAVARTPYKFPAKAVYKIPSTPSNQPVPDRIDPPRGESAYWEVYNECRNAIHMSDIQEAHSVFVELFRNQPWVVDKAFFWLHWIQLHEKNSEYEMAAELYEQAFKHKAKVRTRFALF